MGSGFSACTGPSSVGVSESGESVKQTLKKNRGVLSDSCDSGISVNEGNRKTKSRPDVIPQQASYADSEEEMVTGTDSGCGTDILMTSTPRPSDLTDIKRHPDTRQVNDTANTSQSNGKKLKHNPHSVPNLLENAIDEEDEEGDDGQPEDKRWRAQRPPRPKSAHFRKARVQTHRGRTARSRHHVNVLGNTSGDESSADMSSDEGEEDFDSDILSIPDETTSRSAQPSSLTTVKLDSRFQLQPNLNDSCTSAMDVHNLNNNDDMYWWTEDCDVSARTRESRQDSTWSQCSSFTPCTNSRLWSDGRVAKKASERSISSILLTAAVEPDSTAAATNPACFAVTNPEITQHIFKSLQEIEQDLRAATLALCAREKVSQKEYYHAVISVRPRFLRLLGDFKMASGEILGRLPVDCQHIVQLEQMVAERMMTMALDSSGPLELSPLVTQHLQDLEELCDREAVLPARSPRLPVTMPANRKSQPLWDESGVEDESDSMEEDLQCPRSNEPQSGDCTNDTQMPGLSSLPPRGQCKSARATKNMSSSRTQPRSNSQRPATDIAVVDDHRGRQAGDSETDSCITDTKSTSITAVTPLSTSSASRCSTSKGGRKSRPDSGIVVSSCSTSYSSSEATKEVDGDLAAQAEWIATSLEMLEQILQVRTESHATLKSLVDAITHKSTSEQLKAHALYRWLASQSMTYYAKCQSAEGSSPTGKLQQLAEGKICYASLFQEMARAADLKCEKIDGYAKGPDYRPGLPVAGSSDTQHRHSWNAVRLGGHYHFLDACFGALPCKFFVEHFFMTPPDEMRLSHFPQDKRWLLMTQSLSMEDFEGTLKTWPAMFAFNIRPLNMKSVLKSYDGRLSITVLLRNVVVTPQLEYVGPGTPQDADALAFNIDQEIRNVDNAETFHLNLPEEGVYYFTLMVHDLEEDEDIPAFQYRVEYSDELL